MPAIIDYILAATNSRALHYIGHSQGCTSFFIMLDYRPEYNAKVTSMHALAPAVFIGKSSLVPRPIVNGAEEIQVSRIVHNFLLPHDQCVFMPNIVGFGIDADLRPIAGQPTSSCESASSDWAVLQGQQLDAGVLCERTVCAVGLEYAANDAQVGVDFRAEHAGWSEFQAIGALCPVYSKW